MLIRLTVQGKLDEKENIIKFMDEYHFRYKELNMNRIYIEDIKNNFYFEELKKEIKR